MKNALALNRWNGDRSDRGFTLVEVLVSLTLLLLLLGTATAGFTQLMLSNRRNQFRGDAVAAGRQVIDNLRLVRVDSMPSGNASADEVVTVDGQDFNVTVTYCPAGTDLCGDNTRRHIRVEVAHSSDLERIYYTTETVFTNLD